MRTPPSIVGSASKHGFCGLILFLCACPQLSPANPAPPMPLVIPQPQAMRLLDNNEITIRTPDSGACRIRFYGEEPLLSEAAGLLRSTLSNSGGNREKHPPTATIVLIAKSALYDFAAQEKVPVFTTTEIAALNRSDQAYIIRTQSAPPGNVWVVGSSPQGVHYGVTTLIQLMAHPSSGKTVLPHVEVQDYPDFAGRMCADWVLAWDWEINGYDWGDGVEAFIARCKQKIDFCARYKINRIRFLGGRIAPGPGYMQARWSRILRFAPELNRYARAKGIALQYSSTSFGIDHYSWGLPYPEPWVLNRKTYPDGDVYSCIGGTAGSCLSNDELIGIIIQRQKQLVKAIEPGSLYLHNIDVAMYKDLAAKWKTRCRRCRELYPDDEPFSPRGLAGAVAHLYNRITSALQSVKNPSSGYDAAKHLEIIFASPGYTYYPEDDTEWASDLKYFSEISRQLLDKRDLQLTFREQFNRRDGGGLRTAEMARTLEQTGWPNAMLMFAVQGGDFLESANLLVSSPVLTGTYRGAGTLYNFNGHVFSDVQVLANANYAWNTRAAGSVDPVSFPGPSLQQEVFKYARGLKHSDFLYGPFLEKACAAVYGERAAPAMAKVFRFERANGPVIPLVAGIERHLDSPDFNWAGQAERNRQAERLVAEAITLCDSQMKSELTRLERCLEVVARICTLADARHRGKQSAEEIKSKAAELVSWLESSFEFQIAEPDGGDPALWKKAIQHLAKVPAEDRNR